MADEIVKQGRGRPTVITEDTVKKLEEALKKGASDLSACSYAEISTHTFYDHYNADEDFSHRINLAKQFTLMKAQDVIVEAIADKKDVNTAKWYVERNDPVPQQPAAVQNTQVNIFQMLNEKYAKRNGQAAPDVVIEAKHD